MMFRLCGETVGTLAFGGTVCVRSDCKRFEGLNGVSNKGEALTMLRASLADKLFSPIALLAPLSRVVALLILGSGGGEMVGSGWTVAAADEFSKVGFPISPAPTMVN